LIADDTVEGSVDLIPYNPKTIYTWNKDKIHKHNWASVFYGEYKFKSSTWYDFLANYIVPQISHKITYNSPIKTIEYSGQKVVVTNTNNTTFEGDKVIVTVPTTILKNNSINFVPSLPSDKIDALENTYMPNGLKVFFEFSEQFYPDILLMGPLLGDESQERIFYNAAFKKNSNKNILGLFTVGNQASEYTNLASDQAIFDKIMEELNLMFDGKASLYYKNHVIQNWTAEPFIQGSYTHFDSEEAQTVEILKRPLENKVFFAGEAYSEDAGATVHGAGLSAYSVIKTILKG